MGKEVCGGGGKKFRRVSEGGRHFRRNERFVVDNEDLNLSRKVETSDIELTKKRGKLISNNVP